MMKKHLTFLTFFALAFSAKMDAQFSGTIQNLTASSSSKMHGISLHDLDADGDLDILATFTTGAVSFENDGAGNFGAEKTWFDFDLPTPNNPLPARFADLDGDSLPDLAAHKFWRKNLGNGQFAAPIQAFSNPLAALCDVDGDGWLDAIEYSASSIGWRKNQQNGTFSSGGSITTGANFQFWTVADLNSDGFSDLVFARNFRLYWYKNKHDGTFEGIQLDLSFPKQAITADVDGDGRTDLLAGFGNEIRWLNFDSLGQSTLRQAIPISTFQGGLAIGDFDGDGDGDLVAGDFQDGSTKVVRWFPMLPSGLFSTAATGGVGGYPNGYNRNIVALGDLDGNDEIDVAVGSNIKLNSMWRMLDDSLAGNFGPTAPVGTPISNIYQILPKDLDLDGDEDLVAGNFLIEKTGVGQFAERRQLNLPDQKVQFADLDGDTLPDAIYPFPNSVAWQRNLGNFKFGPRIIVDDQVFLNRDVGIADLDNDGDLDLFAANGTDAPDLIATARWLENDGAGNFTAHVLATDIQYCTDVFSLDWNDDGRLDLFFVLGDDDLWFENLGGGNFSAEKAVWPTGATEPGGNGSVNQKTIIDLDGDGRLDLVCSTRDYSITYVYWYKNEGVGVFSDRKTLLTVGQNASAGGLFFTIFDATDDGILDIAVNLGYDRKVNFLKGLGGGLFTPSKTIVDDAGYLGFDAIVHFDVDGDGRLDLVFGNADAENGGKNAVSWLGGTMTSGVDLPFEKAVFSVAPNPLGSSDFLTIELEDEAFSGPFRVEIWTLDGRLFSVFEKEKRLEREAFLIEKGLPSGAFFVRVLTEKGAGQKLVLRF